MKFSIGDKVAALDDNFDGIVISIQQNTVYVESSDGFKLEFEENELIKMDDSLQTKINYTDGISAAVIEKEPKPKISRSNFDSKKKSIPAMEVDLHIEKLVQTTRGLDNFDILNIQLDTAKRQLEFAIRKRYQRVIFIHGVGEGVLKSELETLFRRYDNLKHYEADLQKYGRGATEVYIPQNPK